MITISGWNLFKEDGYSIDVSLSDDSFAIGYSEDDPVYYPIECIGDMIDALLLAHEEYKRVDEIAP